MKENSRKISKAARLTLSVLAGFLFLCGFIMLFVQYENRNARIRDIAKESLKAEEEYRVLFISSYSQSHFSVPLQWTGIGEGLEGSGAILDTEYMDVKNHPGRENIERFEDMLAAKMKEISYDIVITGDDQALLFADAHRGDLFKDLPVVFLGVNDIETAERVHAEGWATGIPEETDYEEVFRTAAGLFKDCRTFVCIIDGKPTGQGDLKEVRSIESDFPGFEFDIVNTSDLTMAEYISRLEEIGKDAIIFELDAFEDKDGNVYTIDDMVRLVSEHSDRPIFRISTGGVGSGALCNVFLDFETFGQQAAGMAISILGGKDPSEIPLLRQELLEYVFDREKMDQFGLTIRDLPTHSSLLNGQIPLWLKYQDVLRPMLLILLSFVCVIIALIIENLAAVDDAKRLREREAQLQYELYHDSLTGIYNRKGLATLDSSFFRSACVLNIDAFKLINEKYGSVCGDRVLSAYAKRLTSMQKVHAVRIGGDEFLLLFRENIRKSPGSIARIESLLHMPYTYEGNKIDVTSSAGIADRREGMTLENMITSAELAMHYGRKFSHGRSIQVFNSSIREQLHKRTELSADIEKAIEEESFSVLYQPQVDSRTKKLYGLEALCRFKDNKYYPDQFISAAEESSQIINLDRIVTKKVVRQLAEWKKEGKKLPVVSINYSAKQLHDADYAHYLKDLLEKNDIPYDRIKIEITESSIFADREKSREFFNTIHQLGMDIALDDFGTGYSSLTAMARLPVDFVKFDKSLIDSYLVEGKGPFLANLTATIHDLGRKIVAEGIETSDQYRLAVSIGIDQIQGYYFDRPLPGREALASDYSDR